MRALGEKLERFLPFILTGGGIRRSLLRGIENIEKRYIIHIAGFNLGILLHALFGFGTPRGLADAGAGLFFARISAMNLLILAMRLSNEVESPDLTMIVYL